MVKNAGLAKAIIVTGALFFSMPTLAELSLSEITVHTVNEALPEVPAMPSDCIADSAITADALSDTRDNGPFSVRTKRVSRQSAKGFGGGTIHYPTNASGCGLLGAIAVVPGYVSYEAAIKWWGPRLASWGFVVITINTHSIYDDPDSRAAQLNAALDHMITDDTVGSMIDPTRLGAIGWSMGGGGALRLATERSTVRAIMPLAPYHNKSYGAVKTPTLVITCEHDRIAPNNKYSNAFYKNATGPKMIVEVNNGSHFCPSYRFNEILLSKPGIAWMQRHINNDTRFDKFLCANENYSKNPRISAYNYKDCP
ncbi:dienelactone hydrolase family protein [Psychrobacter sp. Sarcosine-3u-12]|uniref:dienelactone hydrolase family protein n=1 Tax=Psychrobacter sp. Sarcosine-3u-12 TaxID=2058325 RepID=UPI000C32E910|nr:alpha/beta hydrolase [Psychrobacter sp. Sarcosine-3u-12]PKG34116.1 alpha/beta hydrolase [Psychrobacter sp. Sarcosine-3u-12]